MTLMTQLLVPCVLAGTALYGTLRRVDVYGAQKIRDLAVKRYLA